MKSFFKMLALIGCVLAFAISSCNNDDDGSQPDGSMTAKVDGDAWSASQVTSLIQNGYTNITGIAADGTTITMTLTGQTEGTYELLQTSTNVGVYNTGPTTPSFASNQGNDVTASVTVTDINTSDSTISGTFKFIAYRLIDNTQLVITEGKFTNVPFTTTISTPGDNFLKAKIDGVAYEASAISGSSVFGIFQITGTAANGQKSIGFILDPEITVGEHDLEGFLGTNTAQYNPDSNTALNSNSGKINITVHDKTNKLIEGTFHFEASDLLGTVSASITDGDFSVKY